MNINSTERIRVKYISLLILIIITLSCGNKPGYHASKTQTGITAKEILIGSSAALTGHASFLGTQLVQGSLAYIKEINRKKGINGRRIRLISYDDRYEPKLCIKNTEKLITEDRVFILFDYVGTPTSKKIIEIINRNRIPVVGLFTGAEFLRNPLQPYILNIRASYFKEVETIVDYWIKRGRNRIAVFMQDDAFGEAVLAGTEIALARHKRVPVIIGCYTRGKLPQISIVKKIVGEKPDAVVMVGTYTPLAHFVKMAKDAGLNDTEFHTVSFVGSEAFARKLIKEGDNVKEKVFVTQVVPSPDDPWNSAASEFRELYNIYYPGEAPNYVAFEGFINAKILVEALKRCGWEISREKLISVIESMSDYNADTGLISDIAPGNHNFFDSVKISRIKDRSFQVIQNSENN